MAWRPAPWCRTFRPSLIALGPHLHLLLPFVRHRCWLATLIVEVSPLTLDGLRVQHLPTPYRTQDRGRQILVLKIAEDEIFKKHNYSSDDRFSLRKSPAGLAFLTRARTRRTALGVLTIAQTPMNFRFAGRYALSTIHGSTTSTLQRPQFGC